nr:unnamed protein product [Callosobruchus chinensis]
MTHISGELLPLLPCLYLTQSREGQFDTSALTYHLQPLSYRRAICDLSLFYRYSNGFCSSELSSIIPPLTEPARCTRRTSAHPRRSFSILQESNGMTAPLCPGHAELPLLTPRRSFFIHQEPNDTTAPLSPGCPGPGMDCLVMYLMSRRELDYSSLASTSFP